MMRAQQRDQALQTFRICGFEDAQGHALEIIQVLAVVPG